MLSGISKTQRAIDLVKVKDNCIHQVQKARLRVGGALVET